MKAICIFVCAFFALTAHSYGQKRTAVQNQPAAKVQSDTAKKRGKGELIKPVKVWKAGRTIDADEVDLTVVYDDLESSAKLYYVLTDSTGLQLADGNIDVSGDDYKKWVVAPNRINWVYNFAIRFLRLQSQSNTVN